MDWFIEFYNYKIANNQSVANINGDNNYFDVVYNLKNSEITTWGIADFFKDTDCANNLLYYFIQKKYT